MNNSSLAIFAIVAALGMLGVVAITLVTIPIQQQAEAAKALTGQCASTIKNASASLCHRIG